MQLRARDEQSYSDSLHGLFETLAPLIRGLKKSGQLRSFFFVRKSPGLRLRFDLCTRHANAERSIAACLDKAQQDRVVARWVPCVYEPEVFKFGGPAAMDAIHAYLFADSLGWWRWEELTHDGSTRIGAKVLSLSILNDLFARFTEGAEEVWDAWCRVSALHGAPVTTEATTLPPLRIAQLSDRVSTGELRVLRQYESANSNLARRFERLQRAGKLLFGHRLVLPHVATSHWNRYGFSLEDRATIFSAMTSAWSSAVHPRFTLSEGTVV